MSNNIKPSDNVALSDNVQLSNNIKPSDNILPSDTIPPSDNIKPSDNVLPSDNVQSSDNIKPSDNVLPSDSVPPSDNVLPSDSIPPSDNMKPSDNVLPSDNVPPSDNIKPSDSDYIKSLAHINLAPSDSVTPSVHFQSNPFDTTHILSPFPLQVLPSNFHCISDVDFTYHHHLYHSVTKWIASILPLLQLLVQSFHLKYILLFCRRDLSHPYPFSTVIKAIQEAIPLWHLSTDEFFAHKFGASIRGCRSFFTYHLLRYLSLHCSLLLQI